MDLIKYCYNVLKHKKANCKNGLIRMLNLKNVYKTRIKEFDIKTTIWICYGYLLPNKRGKNYIKYFTSYTENMLNGLIEEFNVISNYHYSNAPKKRVWVCWLSGFQNAPEIVKTCLMQLSLMTQSKGIELIKIDLSNYSTYIKLPDYIIEKFQKGVISPAHFSDILRFALLKTYGGLWIDSTVLVTKDLSYECFINPFYTLRTKYPERYLKEPSKSQWCGFIIGGNNEFPLFDFLYKALLIYWKEHNFVFDYVLFDYIIITAYRNIGEVKLWMDRVVSGNEDLWKLLLMMNQPFNKEEFRKLCNDNQFFKLTYKMDYRKKTQSDKLTYYGYLTECYVNNEKE